MEKIGCKKNPNNFFRALAEPTKFLEELLLSHDVHPNSCQFGDDLVFHAVGKKSASYADSTFNNSQEWTKGTVSSWFDSKCSVFLYVLKAVHFLRDFSPRLPYVFRLFSTFLAKAANFLGSGFLSDFGTPGVLWKTPGRWYAVTTGGKGVQPFTSCYALSQL